MALSHDVAPGSEILPYIKSDKSLVVYRFSGNVMKEAFNVTHNGKTLTFSRQNIFRNNF